MNSEFGVFKFKNLNSNASFKSASGLCHVGTSDKPKDKKPQNVEPRKRSRK